MLHSDLDDLILMAQQQLQELTETGVLHSESSGPAEEVGELLRLAGEQLSQLASVREGFIAAESPMAVNGKEQTSHQEQHGRGRESGQAIPGS